VYLRILLRALRPDLAVRAIRRSPWRWPSPCITWPGTSSARPERSS